MDPEHNFLAPGDEIALVNPYDEVALEWALRVKENLGSSEINLLTLGPIIAEEELRRCLAMGADHLYWMDLEEKADPWGKSIILARAVRDLGADLVFCGKESLDSRNGQVGAFMAHHLGRPYVSAVTGVSFSGAHGSVTLQRMAGRGKREIVTCSLPSVVSVDLGNILPRLPTFKNKEWAKSQPIARLGYEGGMPSPKTVSMRIFPPRPRVKKVPAPDSRLDGHARIQQLLEGSKIEKDGLILDGDPESQVEGIINFLMVNGLLEPEKIPEKE